MNESAKMIERARSRTRRQTKAVNQDEYDDSLILNAKSKPGDWIPYGKHLYQVRQLFTKNGQLYYMIESIQGDWFQEREPVLLKSN